MRIELCCLAAVVAVPGVFGAEPAVVEDPVFTSDVQVVNVLATVRDKQGRVVADLSKEDFVLKEDGEKQEIRYFARQTELPLTVGLLVDTSMSQRWIIGEERKAGWRFFDGVMDPEKDQAFLVSFDGEIELIQDVTSSKPLLQKGLGALAAPNQRSRRPRRRFVSNQFPGGGQWPGGGSTWPGGGRRRSPGPTGPTTRGPGGGRRGPVPAGGPQGSSAGTHLYDAVYLASDEVLAEEAGRKAIVLISDGVDWGSKVTLEAAVEATLRSDTIVYAVQFVDTEFYGRSRAAGGIYGPVIQAGPNGARALKRLSERTGGRMYRVTEEKPLEVIFDEIEEDLRAQYSLGYQPSDGFDGVGFREISLKVKGKGMEVATREGYYLGR